MDPSRALTTMIVALTDALRKRYKLHYLMFLRLNVPRTGGLLAREGF